MNPTTSQLVFNPTPAAFAVGVGFVMAIGGLAFMAWRRSGYRKMMGWLELLRVVIAIGIAVTLLQPEWLETFKPETKPVVVVLHDVSASMTTKDVIDPKQPTAEPKPREEAVKPLIDPKLWEKLKERMEVVIEPFSSAQTPAVEGTDLHGALLGVLEKQPNLKALVVISDGDWNTGLPPSQAATRLRMRETPVFAVPVGAETRLPDVELTSFDVPTFAVAGKPLRIPFVIDSSLPRDEVVMMEMRASSGEIITKEVTLPAMGRLQDAIAWKPEKAGEVKLTLSVPKTPNERYPENNTQEATLAVRKEQLRVLVIESYPRWEYRYLRNALERDPGVEVSCLLLHPGLGKPGAGRGYLSAFPKDEELTKYDVVFLGDVGVATGQLKAEHCVSLQKLVRDQAGGLVFMPGFHGFQATLQATPLEELQPVLWDAAQSRGWGSSAPGKFALTEAGTHSLLTKLEDGDEASARVWSTLPGFQWYAPALRAKAGTEILATHGTESNQYGRVPLIVTKTYGAGKILFMGTDGAWRWRKGVEDKYHYRFWGQVVRWMAYQRNMSSGDKMRLFYSPDRPRTGDVLTLNANVMSLTGEPLRDGVVIAQIAAPSGKVASVRLLPAGEEAWGLFNGVFTPTEPGEHRVQLTCAEAGSSLETKISIQGTSREKRGQPARVDVLREIAQFTKGSVLDAGKAEAVVNAIAALPEATPQERRLQIWAHPAWAGVLVLLLGLFWVGRKAAGAF